MITITDKAKAKIDEVMIAENYDPSYFVRVSVESGGCSGLSYLLNFDIPIKNKIAYAGILGFFILAFFIPQLDFVMHAFHVPNDLPYRYSFLYSFILIIISSYSLKDIKDISFIKVLIVYILSISFKQIKGETVLHMLESSDIMVSTGSACNSGSKEQEKTLIYTLEDATLAVNTIRISLSTETTFDELNTLITKIKEIGK